MRYRLTLKKVTIETVIKGIVDGTVRKRNFMTPLCKTDIITSFRTTSASSLQHRRQSGIKRRKALADITGLCQSGNRKRRKAFQPVKAFEYITSNYYQPRKFEDDDARPSGHTGPWPASPILVPRGEVQCNVCGTYNPDCSCASQLGLGGLGQPNRLCIRPAGGKGQGVFATSTSSTRDSPVFQLGAVLGEVVGELEPFDFFEKAGDRPWKDTREWEIRLDDGDTSEPLCIINTKRMGNWARYLNHSCQPVATFDIQKISGAWRMMVIALEKIGVGTEVTVFYGNGVLEGKCLCDACCRIS
jgi:hypothetical protein